MSKQYTKKPIDNAVRNLSIIIEGFDTKNNKVVDFEILTDYIGSLGKYYSIIHNKDYDEKGELKRIHYHIVLNAYDKVRKTTLINKISKALEISPETITIEPIIDLNASIRYLLHLDEGEDKHLYLPFEIKTNDKYGLNLSINYMPNTLTPDSLLAIVYTAKANKFQILKAIGMEQYIKYEKVIRVCIDEFFYQSSINSKAPQ